MAKIKMAKIGKSDIKQNVRGISKISPRKKHSNLKTIVVDLLWKKQGGECFCCQDDLDWDYNVISFKTNPTINDMGILCRSCFNKF